MTSADRSARHAVAPLAGGGRRVLLACALANVGGVVAYLPLIGLMLPMRVEALAGSARIGALTAIAVLGLLVASVTNIAFGWWSDRAVARGGTRRGGVIAGVALLSGAYVTVALARDLVTLAAAMVVVQVGVNAVLAPLFAWFAEAVPDDSKGTLGGLIAWGQPAASALAAVLIAAPLPGEAVRLMIVPVAVALFLAPLLLLRSTRRQTVEGLASAAVPTSRGLAIATAARLLVQVAGSVVALYLIYYLESIAPGVRVETVATRAGTLMTISSLVSLPLALGAGRWSDRSGRRRPFLVGSALVAAAGLIVMAGAGSWFVAAASYTLFSVGCAIFLSLNAGVALQMLPDPRHRGRDLGLFNLGNTVPAATGPALAWWLATPRDFSVLLLLLAAFVIAGALVVAALPEGQRAFQ